MDNASQKYLFHANGMHCHSCALLIEETLSKVSGVSNIKAVLGNNTVKIEGDFKGANAEAIAEELSRHIKPHGYTLSMEKQKKSMELSDFYYAIPAAMVFLAIFYSLQKIGFVNFVNAPTGSLLVPFLIGLVASVSTCLAIVGGLTLSISANYAKTGERWKPQTLFHAGRMGGFFILGGIVGALGSGLRANSEFSFILNLIVSIVMVILGINLLDIFHSVKKFSVTMPKSISRLVMKHRTISTAIAPALIGAGTFFLPCGFTQSMQLYALSSGSFVRGGLIMLLFSLGTLPVLALISFGFAGIKKEYSSVLMKAAGIVVIVLALYSFQAILAANGIINPIFTF
ncbi:MAG: sulfite exporter TauE/SafE family protein [Candidatus Wolfebacteria bacterium]|nr:sulfite exporter TauE/SafE family protein [Candidatus Wolfebacteria bacterium]